MTQSRQHQSALALKALHARPGGFIIPNAWDAGTALILAGEGFEAVASTSAGVAFSLGKQDYGVTEPILAVSREEMLGRLAEMASVCPAPLSADLEAGFGDAPEAVADCIRLAVAAGLAGGNIEDKQPMAGLYDADLAVERIAAARAALDELANPFVLNARTDAMALSGADGLGEAIGRANRFREAGADCVFIPGVTEPKLVRALLRDVAAPLNLVVGLGESAVGPRELLDLGVQRVSVGGSIARAALGFVRAAARELREQGTIRYAAGQIHGGEVNAAFAGARAAPG